MRSVSWIFSALAGLALVSPAAYSDELELSSAPKATVDHPARGMSMDKVEATFGAPTNRVPAVGQPPITRWEYAGYVVYFENDIVLHTVAIG